jgi:hypothetical protein
VHNSVSVTSQTESYSSLSSSAHSGSGEAHVSVETVVNGEVVESFNKTISGPDATIEYKKTTALPGNGGQIGNEVSVSAHAEAGSAAAVAQAGSGSEEISAAVASQIEDSIVPTTDTKTESDLTEDAPEISSIQMNPTANSQVAQVDTVPMDHGVLLFIKRFIAYVSSFFG